MFARILPTVVDNRFRGHIVALWIFGAFTLMNGVIDMAAIFSADGAAQSADGIPLSTFPPAAAGAVIGVVALLGLSSLVYDLICALALVRYRSLIPLLYLLNAVQYVAHKGILNFKPIVRDGVHHAGWITLSLFVLGLIGLVIWVTGRGWDQGPTSAARASFRSGSPAR